MKKYLKVLIFSLVIIFIVHLTLFENAYTFMSLSNAFFVVGLFMFFLGLISITDATRIFSIFNYSLKSFFKKDNRYKSYYDYAIEQERRNMIPYALQVLIISIIYITIGVIFSYFVK